MGGRDVTGPVITLICFAVNLLLFWVLATRVNIYFATNDDYRMRLIVSGAYTGVPSSQAVFLNVILSSALAGLYQWAPGVEWYGLFFYGSMYVCATIMVARLLSRAKTWKDFLIRLACVAVFEGATLMNHLLMPQFTTVAAFWCALCVTACLAFFDAESKKGRIGWGILYLLAAFMAVLVRRKVFLMFLPMQIIFCLCHVLGDGATRRVKRINIGVVAAVCLIFAGCLGASFFAERSPEYKEFMDFTKARSEIYDYSGWADYEENVDFYQSIGFSRSAMDCLSGRTFDVNQSVTTENMELISEYTLQHEGQSLLSRIIHAPADALDSLANDQAIREVEALGAILLIGFLLVRRKGEGQRWRFFLWGSMLYGALIIVGLIITGRIMPRIVQSVCLVMAAVAFYELGETQPEAPATGEGWNWFGGLARTVTAALLAVAVITSTFFWLQSPDGLRKNVLENRTILLTAMEDYMRDRPKDFLFYNALNFIGGSDFVFGEPRDHVVNMDSLGHWVVHSPLYYQRNEAYGFHHALDGLLAGKNVYYAELGTVNRAQIESTLNEYGKTLVPVDAIEANGYTVTVYQAQDLVKE